MALNLLFGIFWSMMILAFDAICGYTAAYQIWAEQTFKPAQATIVSATISQGAESTKSPVIEYTYRVDGRDYRGNRYCFGAGGASGGWADAILQQYPAGRVVPCYYQPSSPGESSLRVGLESGEVFFFIFMGPFNAVMLAMWWYVGIRLIRKDWSPSSGRFGFDRHGNQVIRLSIFNTPGAALAGFGAACVVLIFVFGFGIDGHPPLALAFGGLGIAVLTGALVGAWHWTQVQAGNYDLKVDTLSGMVRLPPKLRAGERTMIRIDDIQSVQVDSNTKRERTTYSVALRLRTQESIVLERSLEEATATDLAHRLKTMLKSHRQR